MTKDTGFRLNEKDAKICYAFSLQTCINLVKHSTNQVDHISLLEFFELIGRAADSHFVESDKPLAEKIEYLLDEWLFLINEVRLPAEQYEPEAV